MRPKRCSCRAKLSSWRWRDKELMVSFTGKTNYSQDLICAQSRRRNIIIFLLTYKFPEINLDVPCLPLIISIHHITSTPHTSCVSFVFRFIVYGELVSPKDDANSFRSKTDPQKKNTTRPREIFSIKRSKLEQQKT